MINRVTPAASAVSAVSAFITRWSAASGSERANYQLFITELCDLLGAPKPDPARDDTRDNAYVFERRVQFHHGDGSQSNGFIDCYQRGKFVLEAKKVRQPAAAPTTAATSTPTTVKARTGPSHKPTKPSAKPTLTKAFDDALLRASRKLRPRPARRRRPPALSAGGGRGPRDRAVRRIQPQRRHLP